MINVKKEYDPKKINWWDIHPQMIYYSPFDKLYKRDNSKDKWISSNEMWTIFYISYPDDELNSFYRMGADKALEVLKETFYEDFNKEDILLSECIELFPHECLTAIERALKDEIDSMVQRSIVLRTTEYTLDDYERNDDGTLFLNSRGQAISIKGTSTQLDKARSLTPKLYENYEKLKDKFLKEQGSAKLLGGRVQSKQEKKEI